MKKLKKVISLVLAVVMLLPVSTLSLSALAWRKSPSGEINLSTDLVGMMNVKIFQDSPYITNVKTTESGPNYDTSILSNTLYCYKFSDSTTDMSYKWPHQVGNGPYTDAFNESNLGAAGIEECMRLNENEVAVYMLYDFGDPDSDKVRNNMATLGITDINEYYALMVQKTKIQIDAYAGGRAGHDAAITAYYRYSDDWRSFAKTNSGKFVDRQDMIDMGIAAPNENRFFFETPESQKMLDGRDAFPGVLDPSVEQYIDKDQSFSKPVWEDEDEDASWNIINPVPTCNIYSRWGTEFDYSTKYETYLELKKQKLTEMYGENYTDGQLYGAVDDTDLYDDGLSLNDIIIPKNWEWQTFPYAYIKDKGSYTRATGENAYKSHLGYGEYCPASNEKPHRFDIPANEANDDIPSRFMTVMVRETGTLCGLDGCGHWHSVKVVGKPTTSILRLEPEVNDDSVVIDYGLSATIPIDNNDWAWLADFEDENSLPGIKTVEISADGENWVSDLNAPVYGRYGTLQLTKFENSWDKNACTVKYIPKIFVNDPEEFYYRITPIDSLDPMMYKPLTGKITVVPASVMYYEDEFSSSDNSPDETYGSSIYFSDNWTYVDSNGNEVEGPSGLGEQSVENVNYGYDIYYENDLGYSNGTAHKGKLQDTMSFTFKGTGFDVIMRTDAADGSIRYTVDKHPINADGTMNSAVTETATSRKVVSCGHDNETTLYQLPVVSYKYDEYAYYTVNITGVTTGNVYIDGVRIYNPLGFYGKNGSDNATMKNYYAASEKEVTFKSVFDGVYDSSSAIDSIIGVAGIVNNWNEWHKTMGLNIEETANFEDYLTIGPNNEIYLAPGQAVVFSLVNTNKQNTAFMVEAKAVSAPTKMDVSVIDAIESTENPGELIVTNETTQSKNIATNTAMYYQYILEQAKDGSPRILAIQNSDDSDILALSNFKYSRILGSSGEAHYYFLDENDNPVQGIGVTIMNLDTGAIIFEGLSDSNGEVLKSNLLDGKYKVYFTVPEDMSRIPARTVTVDVNNPGDSETFRIFPRVLGIGSAPGIYYSATATANTKGVVFDNVRPKTAPGSYKVVYDFSSSNYMDSGRESSVGGTVTLICNSDGTVDYTVSGTVDVGKKTYNNPSGTVKNAVQYVDDSVIINYLAVFKAAYTGTDAGNDVKMTNVGAGIPDGTTITIQAYEGEHAEGECGDPETVVIGAPAVYDSDERGTVIYTFTDENGDPVEGVRVMVNDNEFYSDENGVAQCSNVYMLQSTVTFETPKGYSDVEPEDIYLTTEENTYARTIVLDDIDLTIGAHSSVVYKPSATNNNGVVTIKDFRTPTDAGSYTFVAKPYKVKTDNKGNVTAELFVGTITVTVNADGTASYAFKGSGQNDNGNNTFGNSSGTLTNGEVSFNTSSLNSVSIDYNAIVNIISGGLYTTYANSSFESSFDITAYELENAQGYHGKTATAVLGAAQEYSDYLETSVTYTFVDEAGSPVENVQVSAGGKTLVSNASGIAKCTSYCVGDYTAEFTVPEGYSTPDDDSFSIAEGRLTYAKTVTLMTPAEAEYLFINGDGERLSGVTVTVDGKTYVSDENGVVHCEGIKPVTQTVTFTAPSGYTNPASRIVNFSTSYKNDEALITVPKYNIDIGSYPELVNEPNASESNGVVTFNDFRTASEAGSYKITFDGVHWNLNKNNTGDATVTIIVNNDGSCTYSAECTGTLNGKNAKNVVATDASSYVTVNNQNSISVNYNTLIKAVLTDAGGKAGDFNNLTYAQLTNSNGFTMTAYSQSGASGENGESATITAGAPVETKAEGLTIGSDASVTGDPAITVSADTITVTNFKTEKTAKSYVVSVDMAGSQNSSTGYIDSDEYMTGVLTMVVNTNGTGYYDFDGYYNSGEKYVADCTKQGLLTCTYSDSQITIDYSDLIDSLTDSECTENFKNASLMILNGAQLDIQAFSEYNGQGYSGSPYRVTVGQEETEQPAASFFTQIIENIRNAISRVLAFIRNLFTL